METLMQSGPCSASCCRITMIWITSVSRHLLKWPELYPWKMSHPCTKQERVWNAPTQSCHHVHSYELDKCQGFFQRAGTDHAGRPYCGVVLAYCGKISEDRVSGLQSREGSVLAGASHLGSSSGTRSRYLGPSFGTSSWNTGSNCLPQPDYQSTADYVMQMRRDGFHISPSQALHSFAFIIPL